MQKMLENAPDAQTGKKRRVAIKPSPSAFVRPSYRSAAKRTAR